MKLRLSSSFLPLIFASLFVLAGCDVFSTGETVILNSNSEVPPTAEYTFFYSPEDVNSEGWVEVTSEGRDDLAADLRENGFSREEIVSAEVESVSLLGKSQEGTSQKIYRHVRRAEVYFPSDASSPIAEGEIPSGQSLEEEDLTVTGSGVTDVVKEGAQQARLELEVEEDGFSGVLEAEAEINFRIELEGV